MNFFSLEQKLKDYQAAHFPWGERIVLCLAVLFAYSSVWPNEFVFDDTILIVQNDFLKHWEGILSILTTQNMAGSGQSGMFYRPVPMLFHLLVYQAFGASTIAFHALNVAVHALNACLLYHFATRTGFKKGAAFSAVLLWAVHPLHTEAVDYMCATPELLWSTFCLMGLIALLPDFSPRRVWVAAIFLLLALGSKETSAIFPVLATGTLFFVSKDSARFSIYLRTWPLWLLAVAYIIVWVIFTHQTDYTMKVIYGAHLSDGYADNFMVRLITSLATLPTYAGLIIWPENLHMNRFFPVFTTLLAWQPMAGILIAGFGFLQILRVRDQKDKALSFGLTWFAAALFPATGIVFPIVELVSEHWLYFPTMGLFLGLAQTISSFFKKDQNVLYISMLALTFLLGTATFFQNKKWQDTETLYQNITQNGGEVSNVRDYLGLFYMNRNEFDKAAEQFQYILNNADVVPAQQAIFHLQLARALLHARYTDHAITHATKDNADYDITSALRLSDHISEAIAELGKALQADPDCYLAHIYLVMIYQYQGNEAMANFHAKKAQDTLFKAP